jgi:hypothetical protein
MSFLDAPPKEFMDLVEPWVKGRRVVVTTPTGFYYHANWQAAMFRTAEVGRMLGATLDFYSMLGQSVLPKARNQLMHDICLYEDRVGPITAFLTDSDVGWHPYDFWYMVSLVHKNDWPMLGGNYPKKQFYWEQCVALCKQAVEEGKEITEEKLKKWLIDFAFPMPEEANIDSEGCMEIEGLPAGFLCLKTEVLRAMAKDIPSYMDAHFDDVDEVPEWFIDRHLGPPKKGQFIGEDISFFCWIKKLAKSGKAPWGTFDKTPTRLFTLARLSHSGNYIFEGRAADEYTKDIK